MVFQHFFQPLSHSNPLLPTTLFSGEDNTLTHNPLSLSLSPPFPLLRFPPKKTMKTLAFCMLCCIHNVGSTESALKAWASEVTTNLDTQWVTIGKASVYARAEEKTVAVETAPIASLNDIFTTLHQWLRTTKEIVNILRTEAEQSVREGQFNSTYWDSEGFNNTVMPGKLFSINPYFEPLEGSRYRFFTDVANISSVRVSTAGKRTDYLIQDFISWSARLEAQFKDNQLRAFPFLYQYISSGEVLRQFPGTNWPRNHVNLPSTYILAERPWNGAVLAGATDTVIVLDISGSMLTKWDVVEALVRRVLLGVSSRDRFAVVTAGQSYTGRKQRRWERSVEVLGCSPTLSAGTSSAIRGILDEVRGLHPAGGANLSGAIDTAMLLLSNGNSCAQSIVLISDAHLTADQDSYCGRGEYTVDGVWEPGAICSDSSLAETIPSSLGGFNGSLFHFAVHSDSFNRTGKKELEEKVWFPQCKGEVHSRNVFSEAGVKTAVEVYTKWSERQTKAPANFMKWTSPYTDAFGSEVMVLTLSTTFDYREDAHGVAAVDLPLRSIQSVLTCLDGDHTYAFLLNEVGEALAHPYINRMAGIFPNIEELEMWPMENGTMQPFSFTSLKQTILTEQSGEVTLEGPIRVLLGANEDGFDVVQRNKTYTWTRVEGFTVCVVSHPMLSVQRYVREEAIPDVLSATELPFFHRLDKYTAESSLTHGFRLSLADNTTTGRQTAFDAIGYYVAPGCYCQTALQQSSRRMTLEEVVAIDAALRDPSLRKSCSSLRMSFNKENLKILC